MAIKQESYIKDTTDFINFIENTQIPDNVVLATLDVCSLHTNIPQEEGIDIVRSLWAEMTSPDKRECGWANVQILAAKVWIVHSSCYLIENSLKIHTNIPETSRTSKIVGKILNTSALKMKLMPLKDNKSSCSMILTKYHSKYMTKSQIMYIYYICVIKSLRI